MDEYSGTSSIPGLSTFSLASHLRPDRLRPSASAGVRYGLAPNQSVSAEIDFRQQAYSTDPVVALMAKYSVGF